MKAIDERRLSRTACAAITMLAGLVLPTPAGAISLASPDPGGDAAAAVPLPPPEGRYFGFNDDAAHSLHGLVPTTTSSSPARRAAT